MQIVLMNINAIDVKKRISHPSKRNEIHGVALIMVNCRLSLKTYSNHADKLTGFFFYFFLLTGFDVNEELT